MNPTLIGIIGIVIMLAIPFGFGSEEELAIADARLGAYDDLPSIVGI